MLTIIYSNVLAEIRILENVCEFQKQPDENVFDHQGNANC